MNVYKILQFSIKQIVKLNNSGNKSDFTRQTWNGKINRTHNKTEDIYCCNVKQERASLEHWYTAKCRHNSVCDFVRNQIAINLGLSMNGQGQI